MAETTRPTRGLTFGLVVFGFVLVGLAILLLLRAETQAHPAPSNRDTAVLTLEQALPDAASLAYLAALERTVPDVADQFRREADAALRNGMTSNDLAQRLLWTAMSQLKPNAAYIRRARVSEFDALIGHFRSGLETLERARSPWCEAETVEALLKQPTPDLIETFLAQFPYGSDGYDWALTWSRLYLEAAQTGRSLPYFHAQRTWRDKATLQDRGLAMGSQQWALALQIAAFSQAEGQGYDNMRLALEGINVCRLGTAMADLSDSLPEDTRGRIWADLMPELFYGNTPYVLAVVTDFFFLG